MRRCARTLRAGHASAAPCRAIVCCFVGYEESPFLLLRVGTCSAAYRAAGSSQAGRPAHPGARPSPCRVSHGGNAASAGRAARLRACARRRRQPQRACTCLLCCQHSRASYGPPGCAAARTRCIIRVRASRAAQRAPSCTQGRCKQRLSRSPSRSHFGLVLTRPTRLAACRRALALRAACNCACRRCAARAPPRKQARRLVTGLSIRWACTRRRLRRATMTGCSLPCCAFRAAAAAHARAR